MTTKAIGLDFFGTLAEAEANRNACASKMCERLRECGYAINDGDFISSYQSAAMEHRRTREADLREVNNRVWVADALRRMGYDADPASPHVASVVEAYFKQWRITLFPDALPFLKAIKGMYMIALVSNFTDSGFLNETLSRLQIDGFFDFVIDSDTTGWRKPHPNIFKRFLELTGVKAEDSIFVGDEVESDIKGAKAVGIRTVLLTRPNSKRSPEDELGNQPDFTVNSLSGLERLLDEWI